ncbi:MAG: hypothetical protein DCE90_03080 [Pseudanabaena sp.]|nr:MAG: hypothetical protein DCE90_03080 [Pseudanabaena sp.]
MDGLISPDRLNDWLLLVAAIVASMVIFSALEKVAKLLAVPLATAAIVLIVAKVAFGVSPEQLWYTLVHAFQKFSSRFI